MSRLSKSLGAFALLSTGLLGCNPQTEPATQPMLAVGSNPLNINDEGETTTVRVSAFNADSTPGTGTVSLIAAAGRFANGERSQEVTLENGRATADFSCVRAEDARCTGFVAIDAEWNAVRSRGSVQVFSSSNQPPQQQTDGGTQTDGGNPQQPDGGSGGGHGAPTNILSVQGERTQVGLRSMGRQISVPVSFQVVDANEVGVPGVKVRFDMTNAPVGVTLSQFEATTNAEGLATTILTAGDQVGVAKVTATATVGTTTLKSETTTDIAVVGSRASDKGFQVSCAEVNLAANASTTPPAAMGTVCQAALVDRFGNPVGFPQTVIWGTEAGSVGTAVLSDAVGLATTDFNTFGGKYPPVDVMPLAESNEPSESGMNPRDMLVTLIAVTSGEEEFYDGSGVSNGVKNGKWDPGEWFVDVAEPFVDANDNQKYDLGEDFIDTQRLDCTTGKREATPNGKWDGPNGCWDGDIQLWRPFHILYSGFSDAYLPRARITDWQAKVPAPVPVKSSTDIDLVFSDAFFNVASRQGDFINATLSGGRGSAEITWKDYRLGSRYYGFTILNQQLATTPDATAEAGYKTTGACNPGAIAPAEAESDPRLARCVRGYSFRDFSRGNTATLTVKGAEEANKDKDGNALPPTSGLIEVSWGNEHSSIFTNHKAQIQ